MIDMFAQGPPRSTWELPRELVGDFGHVLQVVMTVVLVLILLSGIFLLVQIMHDRRHSGFRGDFLAENMVEVAIAAVFVSCAVPIVTWLIL